MPSRKVRIFKAGDRVRIHYVPGCICMNGWITQTHGRYEGKIIKIDGLAGCTNCYELNVNGNTIVFAQEWLSSAEHEINETLRNFKRIMQNAKKI